MVLYSNITEEYISGYLSAISRLKDLLTPYLGGFNQFFSILKDRQKSLQQNIQEFMVENKEHYLSLFDDKKFQNALNQVELMEISDWKENVLQQITQWTCDKTLESIKGKNGDFISAHLVHFLLPEFFGNSIIGVYKLLPEWGTWHWAEQMSEEFVFETEDKIYIMHFGESS